MGGGRSGRRRDRRNRYAYVEANRGNNPENGSCQGDNFPMRNGIRFASANHGPSRQQRQQRRRGYNRQAVAANNGISANNRQQQITRARNHNSFSLLMSSPFQAPDPNDAVAFNDGRERRITNRTRGRGRNGNHQQGGGDEWDFYDDGDEGEGEDDENDERLQSPSSRHITWANGNEELQYSDNNAWNDRSPQTHLSILPPPPLPNPFDIGSPGGAVIRACPECSAVRRANLKMYDWIAAGVASAQATLEAWGDEMGVGRGCADEMDWQPEPVVRVLIVNMPEPEPSSSSSSGAANSCLLQTAQIPANSADGGGALMEFGGMDVPLRQQEQQQQQQLHGAYSVGGCLGVAPAFFHHPTTATQGGGYIKTGAAPMACELRPGVLLGP